MRGEVFGSGGMATMGDGRRTGMVVLRAGRSCWWTPHAATRNSSPDAYVAELAAFVDAVRGGTPAPVGGEDARAALAIALAAAESVRAGRPVRHRRRWEVTGRVDTGSSYRLAVSAEMVFVDLPFLERVRRIADAGFEVEIWDWTKKDVDALARTGATFSSMTGYITGTLADPDGAEELLRTAEESLKVAEQLDCPRLNVHGTGLDPQGLPVLPTDVVTPAHVAAGGEDPDAGSPSWASGPGGCSRWRTSTPPSTTPARRSRRLPTRSRWSRPSTART